MQSTKWVHEALWVPKVKVMHDLGPDHSDSIFLNVFSSVCPGFNIFSAPRGAIQDQWSSGLSIPKIMSHTKLWNSASPDKVFWKCFS